MSEIELRFETATSVRTGRTPAEEVEKFARRLGSEPGRRTRVSGRVRSTDCYIVRTTDRRDGKGA